MNSKRRPAATTNLVSALAARTQFEPIMKTATQKSERVPEELRAMQATAKRTGANRLTPGQINRIVSTVRKEQRPLSLKRQPK